MRDPKKAANRTQVRLGSHEREPGEDRAQRQQVRRDLVILRIGPAATLEMFEALERAAAEDAGSIEVVLPTVYELVIVPGPGLPQ